MFIIPSEETYTVDIEALSGAFKTKRLIVEPGPRPNFEIEIGQLSTKDFIEAIGVEAGRVSEGICSLKYADLKRDVEVAPGVIATLLSRLNMQAGGQISVEVGISGDSICSKKSMAESNRLDVLNTDNIEIESLACSFDSKRLLVEPRTDVFLYPLRSRSETGAYAAGQGVGESIEMLRSEVNTSVKPEALTVDIGGERLKWRGWAEHLSIEPSEVTCCVESLKQEAAPFPVETEISCHIEPLAAGGGISVVDVVNEHWPITVEVHKPVSAFEVKDLRVVPGKSEAGIPELIVKAWIFDVLERPQEISEGINQMDGSVILKDLKVSIGGTQVDFVSITDSFRVMPVEVESEQFKKYIIQGDRLVRKS